MSATMHIREAGASGRSDLEVDGLTNAVMSVYIDGSAARAIRFDDVLAICLVNHGSIILRAWLRFFLPDLERMLLPIV
jgi:hypothetical protein